MKSLRASDAIGWVLLVLVVTFGVTLVVTPSTVAPLAQGTRTAEESAP